MPNVFEDVRLDEEIERGAIGGPVFKTNVARLNSGHAKRLQLWTQPLGRWDIAYGLRELNDSGALDGMRKIISFFYARLGRLRTFRFKDFFDFEATLDLFGTGDGATLIFQLTHTHVDTGAFTFIKTVTKPVNGTVSIFDNAILQTETTDYSIDYSTGLVTFVVAPVASNPLTWTGEYDKHVSFEQDALEIDMGIFNAGSIPSITIQEERE